MPFWRMAFFIQLGTVGTSIHRDWKVSNFQKMIIDLVIQRINRLTDRTKRVLQVAAVIGSRFSSTILSAACETENPEIYDNLTAGIDSKLIERTELEYEYQFVHDRIQEALLNSFSSQDLKKPPENCRVLQEDPKKGSILLI